MPKAVNNTESKRLQFPMRSQTTVYLHSDTKEWLTAYAREFRLAESEVIRLLLEREQQIGWLRWALGVSDPAQPDHTQMRPRADGLPPRWNEPPKRAPGRKVRKPNTA
jgi:hypothetical protein